MGEIDTKPIESVQTALSFFGEKGDHQRKNWSPGRNDEKERELENVLKDLANYKVQLEAKEAAYMHAVLKLEHTQKSVEELSTLLKNNETERERYENTCREARTRIRELESETKEMADQLSERTKSHEQLPFVLLDLEATKEELISKETELAAIKESEIEALTQAEMMEIDLSTEMEKCEELKKRVSELNDAIRVSEKEKHGILSEKDAEIELARKALLEAEERLEDMKREMEETMELDKHILSKSKLVDTLQLQLKEAIEQLSVSAKSASDAIAYVNLLQEKLEINERKISSQEALIEAFKMEMTELKIELKNANELASHLTSDVDMLTGDLQKAKSETDEAREKEMEAQVEIAMLRSELHKGRSKNAAAEAAEARAESAESGLDLAVQHLAIEADTVKNENEMLKQSAEKANEVDTTQVGELNTETKDSFDASENESLMNQAEDEVYPEILTKDPGQLTLSENQKEVESLRKELDAAVAKVAVFRNRAEQATCRAEMAEKAKTAIEDQLRKWREERQKKKLALASLIEISEPNEFNNPRKDDKPPQSTHYQPLYKVLNMKF